MTGWDELNAALEPARATVVDHDVYEAVDDRRALCTFMEHHAFAVWDFMSLLTRLQRDLTCVELPWRPRAVNTALVRFVNELKLAEESDDLDGEWTSHFDLYLDAMREAGADTGPIVATVRAVALWPGWSAMQAARSSGAPTAAVEFVGSTFRFVEYGTTLEVAAAFSLGREQLIPALFRPLLDREPRAMLFDEYLARHVELDGDEHGPMARRLVTELADGEPDGWSIALSAAFDALQARRDLWDAALHAIDLARV